MNVWTNPGRCSSRKFCCMEPDGNPYCAHPVVLEKNSFGASLDRAIKEFCGQKLKLREAV